MMTADGVNINEKEFRQKKKQLPRRDFRYEREFSCDIEKRHTAKKLPDGSL